MTFAAIIERARADFMEMPDLELTVGQAVRLWNLGADDCRYVIDSLVDARFLRWTARRSVVRTGIDLPLDAAPSIDKSVVAVPVRNISVGNGR